MSSKTKIIVLHMKEVIYTAVFLLLAAAAVILLFVIFGPAQKRDAAAPTTASASRYIAGIYTTSIELNDNTFDVQVSVDRDRITAIELINLSESTAAVYPLMEPTLEQLAEQICETQSTDGIAYQEESKYTSMLLLEAIKTALSRAVPSSY